MSDAGTGSSPARRLVVLAGRKGRPSLLPFAAVLLFLLTVGLIGLLLLNTALNRGAFQLKQEQRKATKLTQEAEQEQQDLARLSEPNGLASRAQQLGMVPNGNPAFRDPNSGAVIGSPTPAVTPSAPPPSPAGGLVPNTGPTTAGPTAPGTATPSPSGTPLKALPTTPAPSSTPTTVGTPGGRR